MPIEKILIIDNDLAAQHLLVEGLRQRHYDVEITESAPAALMLLQNHSFDLVFIGVKTSETSGLDFLKQIKQLYPQLFVVVLTAHGSIENAVESMTLGAFHYLTKPFSLNEIDTVIQRAKEHLVLLAENHYLRQAVTQAMGPSMNDIVGESPVMKVILAEVLQVAKSHASIFITGESGTGKEVIAHAIHYNSEKAHRPFIRVNCAAVPEALIESEFFGHERGSFTGANSQRIGRFELAHTGTLLLDEITEVPINLQAKLLRAIQEQEFERVGGTKSVKVDVRLISTSNRDIKKAIEQKKIREDLYYRLNVIPIYLPPLRDRKEDIIPLSEYFLERSCIENHKPLKTLTFDAKKKLLNYSWPGNIRELANIIERAVVLNNINKIDAEHICLEGDVLLPPSKQLVVPLGSTLDELEKQLIMQTLDAQNNNRTKTAGVLGISIRTLRNKLHLYRTKN